MTDPFAVATNICSGSFSHNDVWCLLWQFWHPGLLRQSAALCFGPVQLKHSCLTLSTSFVLRCRLPCRTCLICGLHFHNRRKVLTSTLVVSSGSFFLVSTSLVDPSHASSRQLSLNFFPSTCAMLQLAAEIPNFSRSRLLLWAFLMSLMTARYLQASRRTRRFWTNWFHVYLVRYDVVDVRVNDFTCLAELQFQNILCSFISFCGEWEAVDAGSNFRF